MTGRHTVLLVMALWSAGFLVGTTTHTIDLVLGGLDAYSGFPPPVRLFWVTLTALDPLVVVLFWLRLRVAIVLAVVIMAIDVSVNVTVFAIHGSLSIFSIVLQVLFGCFIVATGPWLWHRLRRDQPSPAPEPQF